MKAGVFILAGKKHRYIGELLDSGSGIVAILVEFPLLYYNQHVVQRSDHFLELCFPKRSNFYI